MRAAAMFLIGLVIGVGLGWVAFTILANYGFDYSLPHLPK